MVGCGGGPLLKNSEHRFLQYTIEDPVAIANKVQALQWSAALQEEPKVLEIFAPEERRRCYVSDDSAGLAQSNSKVSEKAIKVGVAEERFLKAGSLISGESHSPVRRVTNNQVEYPKLIRPDFQSVS